MLDANHEQAGKHREPVRQLPLNLCAAEINNRRLKIVSHSPRNLPVDVCETT